MRILREKKNLSRGQAILWGLRSRAAATGLARSMVKTASILAIDCFRAIISTVLRIAVLVPLRLARSFVGLLTGKNVAAQGE